MPLNEQLITTKNTTFTDQQTVYNNVVPQLTPLMAEMNKWKPVWEKLPEKKKLEWLNEHKSPLISAAIGLYIYLAPFFEDLDLRGITLDTKDFKVKVDAKELTARG